MDSATKELLYWLFRSYRPIVTYMYDVLHFLRLYVVIECFAVLKLVSESILD